MKHKTERWGSLVQKFLGGHKNWCLEIEATSNNCAANIKKFIEMRIYLSSSCLNEILLRLSEELNETCTDYTVVIAEIFLICWWLEFWLLCITTLTLLANCISVKKFVGWFIQYTLQHVRWPICIKIIIFWVAQQLL